MKFEWKKNERQLYLPKEEPEMITIPEHRFFMISGTGNPNSEAFSEKVGVLYSLAYAVRMMPKQGYTPEGYYEYTVYPLEGIWDLTENGKKSDTLNKDELLYTIMIRQPDFVTPEVADKAFAIVKKKKNHPLLDQVVFQAAEDRLSVQMMHLGSYDDEPQSFELMNKFIIENSLIKTSQKHREIYITDARKTDKSKLKTVLRYMVGRI